MKKQKITIISSVIGFLILVSFIAFQTNLEGSNLQSEIKSLSQEKENVSVTLEENEKIITTFQDSNNLLKLTGDGVITFDKDDYVIGEHSLKISTKGNLEPEIVRITNLSPSLDLSEKFIKAWLKISDRSSVAKLRIKVSSDNFETYQTYMIHERPSSPTAKYFQNNKWSLITISKTQAYETNNPDLSKINAFEIFVKDNGNHPITVWFNSLSLVENNSKGIVTFTFDDAVATQFTNALPILSKYNYSATSYIPTNWVNGKGRLTVDQLKEMQDVYGWDISAHTLNHMDVSHKGNEPRLEKELVRSKQFLLDNGLEKGADHFAYPFGNFDSDRSMEIIKEHYKTARIVRGDIETLPVADPYRLRVIYVLSYTPPDIVLNRINNVIDNGDWAILVFHGIVDKDPYDVHSTYLKSNFQTIVDGVYNKGIDVMTISEVYNKYFEN